MSEPLPPTPRRGAAFIIGAAAVLVAVFLLGIIAGGHPNASGLDRLPASVRSAFVGGSVGSLPDQTIDVLTDRYQGPVDRQRLERIGAAAIARSFGDRYTAYFTPEEYRALNAASKGEYAGVGIRVFAQPSALVIREVFPRSPAARAGLRTDDRIVGVGGISVARRGAPLSVDAIVGKPGTTVSLRVKSPGAGARTVVVRRGHVVVPMVEGRIVRAPDGRTVAVVVLDRFERGVTERLGAEIRGLLAKGATAVALDMRGNPGGLLDEAVGVSGLFLPPGAVVVSTSGRTSPKEVFRTDGDPIPAGIAVVVLVDHASASASEIVAGALKDHGRAVIVGDRTFGKAKVQVSVPTSDGGAVRVTIARYLTPNGTDIAHRGVQPDVRAADAMGTRRDEALAAALARIPKHGG